MINAEPHWLFVPEGNLSPQSGPFGLLTYEHVSKHLAQLVLDFGVGHLDKWTEMMGSLTRSLSQALEPLRGLTLSRGNRVT